MRRFPAYGCALRTLAVAVVLVAFINRAVSAVTSNWTNDAGGDFSDPANWDNGVPGPADTAVFRGGDVAYDVQFTHDVFSNQLRVGSNTVNLLPLSGNGTYTVTDSAHSLTTAGIIIGELAGDRAVVNSYLPTLIGQFTNLGEAKGSSGTLNVNAGSVSLSGMVIGVAGTGSFSLANGAIADTSSTTLANSTGSFGTAIVDGIGSYWNVRPTIGYFGTGELKIRNGGHVNSSGNVNLGVQQSGWGSVTVDGVSSTLSIASAFNVGSSGVGNVSILNGGQVQSGSATIQRSNILINGAGSTWTNLGSFRVLLANLTISDGAILNAQQSFSGDNTTIYGAKSELNSLGPISSYGQFVVSGGAIITSSSGTVAGMATISGRGSAWNVGGAFGVIADANEIGNLELSSGGKLSARTAVSVGADSGGISYLSVSGFGSEIDDLAFLNVGLSNGTATLRIIGGGTISVGTNAIIMAGDGGRNVPSTANAMALVDGAGSSLMIGGNLQVGGNSGGSLVVSNGARIADATSVVYPKSFNTPGTVSVTGTASEWTNLGNLILDGELTVSNGARVTVGGLLLIQEQGELHGDGTVMGNVQNGVLVAPGNSLGRLTIAGAYTQLSSGTLQIELAGINPGTDYDQLSVTGSASLNGALLVSLINSFTPKLGDFFDILDWDTLSGTFSTLQLPALNAGLAWDTSQLYTTGVISVTAVREPAAWMMLVGMAPVVVGVRNRKWLSSKRRPASNVIFHHSGFGQ